MVNKIEIDFNFIYGRLMLSNRKRRDRTMKSWIEHLDTEDLAFMKRFVLASGSLKEMARVYSVSYPTVRLRLDRLIQKIQIVEEAREASRFEVRLRTKMADGKIDTETFRELMNLHMEALEDNHE